MPATKIKSDWVSGNLVFSEKVASNGGQVIFGGTNGGVDVVFRGTTSSVYSMWDESANGWVNVGVDMALGDSTYLRMGASTDASLGWDAAKLVLTGAAVASTFQLGSSGNDINTRFIGTIIVGSTGKSVGRDVTFYGTTAVARMLWDADQNTLDFDGAGVHLDDTDKLRMGDSTDATLCWDAAKIALTAAADGSGFQVGTSTLKINTQLVGTLTIGSTGKSLGKDVTFYGTTAINRLLWDADQNLLELDGADIHLDDGDFIKFGDSSDVSLCWDATKIALTGAAASSTYQAGSSGNDINTRLVGTLIVGSTGKSLGRDVTFYGTTAANYAKWTAASNRLDVIGSDIHLSDSDYLKLGSSSDISLCFDSAKLALTSTSAVTYQIGSSAVNINSRFVGTVIVGSTGKSAGGDVTLYGTTAVNFARWIAASNLLELDGADIHLDDGDFLKLGDSSDVSLSFDATKLALTSTSAVSFQVGSSAVMMNTRMVGTLIVGSTGAGLGKNVTLYGTSTANRVMLTAASNRLELDGIKLTGTSVPSEEFNIQAYGTSLVDTITVKNSTGDAAVLLSFFNATPVVQQTNAVQIGASTSYTTTVQTRVNTILTLLKNFGLMATS